MAKIIGWLIVFAIAIMVLWSMGSWPWWVWAIIIFVLFSVGAAEKAKEEREMQEQIDRRLLAEENLENYILTSGDIEAINLLKIAHENPNKFFPILNGGIEKGNKTLKNAVRIYLDAVDEIDDEYSEEEEYNEEGSKKNNHQNDSVENIDDCFSVLEIPSDSSSSDIKSAYRKKMAEYHPDKVFKLGDKLKKIANEESKRVNIAYSMLKDSGYV